MSSCTTRSLNAGVLDLADAASNGNGHGHGFGNGNGHVEEGAVADGGDQPRITDSTLTRSRAYEFDVSED